jgi:hypothetical protein
MQSHRARYYIRVAGLLVASKLSLVYSAVQRGSLPELSWAMRPKVG